MKAGAILALQVIARSNLTHIYAHTYKNGPFTRAVFITENISFNVGINGIDTGDIAIKCSEIIFIKDTEIIQRSVLDIFFTT